MNLRHFANEIGRGARPAADVTELQTLVDRKLVLMWAQSHALKRAAADSTLDAIEIQLVELEILQGACLAAIPA
jgi:hypothetical protein